MKFNKELILQNKTVVHCKTEEEANLLLKWADSIGLMWWIGISYLEFNNYDFLKEKTCYNLKTGDYADLNFYEENDYKILSFEEVKI